MFQDDYELEDLGIPESPLSTTTTPLVRLPPSVPVLPMDGNSPLTQQLLPRILAQLLYTAQDCNYQTTVEAPDFDAKITAMGHHNV
jgi:hypothetical protein